MATSTSTKHALEWRWRWQLARPEIEELRLREVAGLDEEAWRRTAPKRVVAQPDRAAE